MLRVGKVHDMPLPLVHSCGRSARCVAEAQPETQGTAEHDTFGGLVDPLGRSAGAEVCRAEEALPHQRHGHARCAAGQKKGLRQA